MENIIRHPLAMPQRKGRCVELHADRQMLAKRRWHGVADDGTDFGFDLEGHLHDGDVILENDAAHYVLRQKPEPVLEVGLRESSENARIAWSLGNLHFPIELDKGLLRVADDPAIRLYLEREKIAHLACTKVFHPIQAAHSHGHGHSH